MSKPLMAPELMPSHYDAISVDVNGRWIGYSEFVSKLFKPYALQENRLDHGIIGLAGEVGEICDEVKQLTIYEKELNCGKLVVELGDAVFYLQGIMNEFGITWQQLMQVNADKLAARYHKLYYSNEQALQRADGEAKGAGNAE